MASSEVRMHSTSAVRRFQNYYVVWLDESKIDCSNFISELQQIVNQVNTFTDLDECIDFITDIEEDKAFVVISEAYIHKISAIIQEIPQIHSIYIFNRENISFEERITTDAKIKGVYTDAGSICKAIHIVVDKYDFNTVSVNFSNASDEIDYSFMYTQLLKEIILKIHFETEHLNEFCQFYREQLFGNFNQCSNIDKFQKEYQNRSSLYWYTYPGSFHSLLNRALRSMEVDTIVKMGFFIRDIHNYLAELQHIEQNAKRNNDPLVVYRGQGLSHMDFDKLKSSSGGLIAFNNFLSTSRDPEVSLAFATSNGDDPNQIGVLFEITIDQSISSYVFADITKHSYFLGENEILFSANSIFRIGRLSQRIEQNNCIWQVNLSMINKDDPDLSLQALTKCLQDELKGGNEWQQLAYILMALGEFEEARKIYEKLLERTNIQNDQAYLFHQLGLIMLFNQGNYTQAMKYFNKSLFICQSIVSTPKYVFGRIFDSIGGVHMLNCDYPNALLYFKKALVVYEKELPKNHRDLATIYGNIGSVYGYLNKYSETIFYHKKSLDILEQTVPSNHPSLAASYSNMGAMYIQKEEYSEALSYYKKALEIRSQSLPPDHPDLGTTYHNMALAYVKLEVYTEALSYYEKILQIALKRSPINYPDLAITYHNIGSMYYEMDEYEEAITYHEKSIEIRQKYLNSNHPSLAESYHGISNVYNKMNEKLQALSYYEKALHIWERILSRNDFDLITSYNYIGILYKEVGQYTKALEYYEKSLENSQKTPSDLATYYLNTAFVYEEIGDYSKALSNFEKTLQIYQQIRPINNLQIAESYNNIGCVLKKMNKYSESLPYFKEALSYCSNAPQTAFDTRVCKAVIHASVGTVYKDMGDYKNALEHYQNQLYIEESLNVAYSHIQTTKQNIEFVRSKCQSSEQPYD